MKKITFEQLRLLLALSRILLLAFPRISSAKIFEAPLTSSTKNVKAVPLTIIGKTPEPRPLLTSLVFLLSYAFTSEYSVAMSRP